MTDKAKAGSSPAERMARTLREERQLARAQMADELRAFLATPGDVSKESILAEIERIEGDDN